MIISLEGSRQVRAVRLVQGLDLVVGEVHVERCGGVGTARTLVLAEAFSASV